MPIRQTRAVRLRAALVWHDEVMGDVVLDQPETITLGESHTATFTIPEVGLPDNFAVVRPGNRGYLLTLGDQMRGRISIDGQEMDVADFVRKGGDHDGPGGFRATPIGGRDWGVVELDQSGDTKLFFHFVPIDPPIPTTLFATFELLLPALAFSVILHTVFIIVSYKLDTGENSFVWPGKRSLTGNYLVTRIEPPPPVEPPKPVVGPKVGAQAASEKGDVENVKSATKNNEGKSGGQGEKRAKDPNAPDDVPNPPKVAFFADKNKKYIDQMLQTNNLTSLNKFMAIKGEKTPGGLGMGKGTGTGVGDDLDGTGTTRGSKGKGTGGGGAAEGDFVSQGKIDTGDPRTPKGTGGTGSGPKEIAVGFAGGASGDFSGLTKEEIDRVVKSRSGLIKACYQKELNRSRNLGGKLVINFVISADGVVKSTRVEGGKSSLRNDAVESCVRSNIQRLKFPAKGGGVVIYPFIFSQGA
jgi:hypothetical protein